MLNLIASQGSSAAKKAVFDKYTDACDACCSAFLAATELLLVKPASELIDRTEIESNLHLYFSNLCIGEYACINHSFPRSWQFTAESKAIRNKKLEEHRRLRDSYDPEIKKQKLEKARNEAIEDRMVQIRPELWNQSQQKIDIEAAGAEMNSLTESLKSKEAQLNNLGFFKFKEKAALEEEISKLKKDIEAQDAIIAKASFSFEAGLREKATEQIDSESSQESDNTAE